MLLLSFHMCIHTYIYVVLNFIIEVVCMLVCTIVGDFQVINSTAVFRAGSVEATVLVSGTVDSIKECEESFQILASLTSSSTNLCFTIGNGTADVVVQDETEGWYILCCHKSSYIPCVSHLCPGALYLVQANLIKTNLRGPTNLFSLSEVLLIRI